MLHASPIRAAMAVSLVLAFTSVHAAAPADGTISPDARMLSFTGGPFVVPNVTSQTEVMDVTGDPVCSPGEGVICDTFALTVDLPDDYYTKAPQDMITIKMSWAQTAVGEDYDFFLYDDAGNLINQGEGTTNPETMKFCAGQGKKNYQVMIIPWNAAGATYKTDVEMKNEPKARCKAPKSGSDAIAVTGEKAGQFGGALGLGLLLPLLGSFLRRRAKH